MRNSGDIIGQLLGGLMNPQAGQRVQHALGGQGLAASNNPLGGILSQLQGGGTAAARGGGALGGLTALAQNFLGSMQRNPAAAGGTGAIAGMLLGGGKGAMRGGALALLGSLAASALSQSGRAAAPQSPQQLPGAMRAAEVDPVEDDELAQRADLLLLAMINAAKADGEIDAGELERIKGKVAEDGVDRAEVEQLAQMLKGPMDFEGLVAQIRDPQTAAEVYAASALAIKVDTEAERSYLANLAARTGLDEATVAELHGLLDLRA